MNAADGRHRVSPRRVLKAVALTMCAVGVLAGASSPALAAQKPAHHKTAAKKPKITPRTPISRGATYVALGDSVTFGYEEPQVVPAPNYSDASSFLGYPEHLGAALHLRVVNAACPGETSSSLIDSTAQSNGCESSPVPGGPFYRQNPLHVSYTGSQLAFAVNYVKHHQKTVRLVSLMIGANDFFVCQETTADKCASLTEQAAVLATIGKNVKTILSAIRNKGHYHGQLAVVNYYSLDYSNTAATEQSALLNQTIDTAANPFHVRIANGFAELEAGALHSGGNTCKAGLLTQLTGPNTPPCGIHPSYSGQALLAQALEKVIRLA